ncbi:Maltose permease [Mycena venus]|uniref:Maltose permease n=1 Tax=Mycena venus TaxID=2733690 RepID=A0A8H6YPK5_9AGAR|nr:Maltose permease [Mycena venus]
MKFTAIIIALASATYTMAGNCDRGLSYCGRSLLHVGKYAPQTEEAVQKAGTNPAHMLDTLFYCVGGKNGDIEVIKDCGSGRCADSGPGKSDICLPTSRIHLILEMDDKERFSVKNEEENAWW